MESQVLRSAPEALFINRCLREPDARKAGELAALASSVHRWDVLVEAAERHSAAAFVLAAAESENVALPATVVEALQQRKFTELAYVMLLDAELARIGSAFSVEGLPLIVLKGPVLARTIYSRASLRPYGDLDLLVPDKSESAAIAMLQRLGYREAPYAAEEARRAQGHAGEGGAFHRVFVAEDSSVRVELHVDPFQLGIPPACEEARWRRAVAVADLPGVWSLSPSDQLVHLCVHAHKHGFSRLIWLKDLDLLIRRRSDCIDWRVVCDVARQEGVLTSVWYALDLTCTLLAAPVDRALLDRLRPSPPIAVLYRTVWTLDRIAGLKGHMRRRAVQFHAAESWRGMLPSLVLMGRRRDRMHALLRSVFGG